MEQVIPQTIGILEEHWPPMADILVPPRNEAQYLELKKLLHQLMDLVGSNETHFLASLMHLVGNLVDQYETEDDPELAQIGSQGTPITMLKFIMDQRGLKQDDLKDIFGSQGNVSSILNGKRDLTVRHIQKLSERFNVPASVFL